MPRRIEERQSKETKLSNIELLIFDWSGVISDDRPPVYEANMRLLERYGKERMTFGEWLPRTRMTPMEFLEDYDIVGDPDELFSEYREMFEQVIGEGQGPLVYPNARDVLHKLSKRGFKLMVVSSHPEEHVHNEAVAYGVREYFEKIFGNIKDKISGLILACDEARISRDCALYIGDTIYDIQAAKKAGLHSAGVASGYHVKERLVSESPELILNDVAELLGLIE